MNSKERIGFIGLGAIGKPMAKNLLEEYLVSVFDVDALSCNELEALGAKTCDSIGELASECSIVEICVRDDKEVISVVSGESGVLRNSKPGTIIVIHSTIFSSTLFEIDKLAKDSGLSVCDAPITGGENGARQRQLCYMVGGAEGIFERVEPIFRTSAIEIINAGKIGNGLALKLCNNMITYLAFTAVRESSRLAEAAGLSYDLLDRVGKCNGVITKQMQDFMHQRSDALKTMGKDEFRSSFSRLAALGKKDLAAAIDLALHLNIDIPVSKYNSNYIEEVISG